MRTQNNERSPHRMLIGMAIGFAITLCALEYGKPKLVASAAQWVGDDDIWVEVDHIPITRSLPKPPPQRSKPQARPLPIVTTEPTKVLAAASPIELPDFTFPEEQYYFEPEFIEAPNLGPVEFADEMPTFPGGDSALYAYLAKELNYPAFAKANHIQGPVYIKFTVGSDGSIHPADFEVLRSPHATLSDEAIRVIAKMPR